MIFCLLLPGVIYNQTASEDTCYAIILYTVYLAIIGTRDQSIVSIGSSPTLRFPAFCLVHQIQDKVQNFEPHYNITFTIQFPLSYIYMNKFKPELVLCSSNLNRFIERHRINMCRSVKPKDCEERRKES